jgi:hypothetical protein
MENPKEAAAESQCSRCQGVSGVMYNGKALCWTCYAERTAADARSLGLFLNTVHRMMAAGHAQSTGGR